MKKSMAITAAIVAVLALAGCSGASPAANSNETVTIKWDTWNPGKDAAAKLIKEFEATHPKIKIDYEFHEYSDYPDALRTELASGTGPDVWFAKPGAFATEFADLGVDLAPYAKKQWGADWKKRFYDIGLAQADVKGRTVALPWMLLASGVVWYNQNNFTKAGITTPPATMADLVTDANKLRAAGFVPFAQGAQDNWINEYTFMAIANQTAPGVLENAQVGKAKWTDPGLLKAMDVWKSLFTDHIMQPGALGVPQYPDVAEKFFGGKTSMFFGGSWDNNSALSTSGIDYQKSLGTPAGTVFHAFMFPDVDGDGQPATANGGADTSIMMNATSKYPKQTWTFISWLLGDGGQKDRASYLIPPAVKGYPLDTANLASPAEQAGDLKLVMTAIGNAKYTTELSSADVEQAFGTALQAVASGQKSSADALAAVQTAEDKVLAK